MHLTRHPTTVVNDSRMVKYRSIYMDVGLLKGWRGVCYNLALNRRIVVRGSNHREGRRDLCCL